MDTQCIVKNSKKYPQCLFDLIDPPEQIYTKGDVSLLLKTYKMMAVVGSRKMSNYGKDAVKLFVPDLVKRGVIVVSGLMYGIDCEAHNEALKTEIFGSTVAVLGWGIDYRNSIQTESLINKIIDSKGLVISEYFGQFPPTKWTFPKRNRIVAALSKLGTFVVEAGDPSGSLITASIADELNRPLYALPGYPNTLSSAGTNKLILTGIAKPVMDLNSLVVGH